MVNSTTLVLIQVYPMMRKFKYCRSWVSVTLRKIKAKVPIIQILSQSTASKIKVTLNVADTIQVL